uniref:Uncharacterized protein n=1 Tax=Fagus sylvatica TaxID=28930 RepID=A0A2N9EUT9_FAGSY
MASSSSLNTQKAIDLNDAPSVIVTATAVAAGHCTPEDGKVLAGRTDLQIINDLMALTIQLLKESKKKVGEVKEENKRLKVLMDSYADD